MTARSPSQSTALLASLAVCFCLFVCLFFAVSACFLPFSPTAEPRSRLFHFILEFLEDKYWTSWWPSRLHHRDKPPLTSKVTYLILQNIEVWISIYLPTDCLSIPDMRSTYVKFLTLIIKLFWKCTQKAGHIRGYMQQVSIDLIYSE